jgi:hypothetical protein
MSLRAVFAKQSLVKRAKLTLWRLLQRHTVLRSVQGKPPLRNDIVIADNVYYK